MAPSLAATGQSGDVVYNFEPGGDSVAVALGDATAPLSPRAAANAHAPPPAGRASALARPGQVVLAAALPPPPLPAAVERVQRGSALVADALCDSLLGLPYNQQAHAEGGEEEAPCPLRPCPPSSIASGLRVESFTHGTGGRLFRPGVGIGMGTMREARYEDLRFIQEIGRGGFGKVRGGCGRVVEGLEAVRRRAGNGLCGGKQQHWPGPVSRLRVNP